MLVGKQCNLAISSRKTSAVGSALGWGQTFSSGPLTSGSEHTGRVCTLPVKSVSPYSVLPPVPRKSPPALLTVLAPSPCQFLKQFCEPRLMNVSHCCLGVLIQLKTFTSDSEEEPEGAQGRIWLIRWLRIRHHLPRSLDGAWQSCPPCFLSHPCPCHVSPVRSHHLHVQPTQGVDITLGRAACPPQTEHL